MKCNKEVHKKYDYPYGVASCAFSIGSSTTPTTNRREEITSRKKNAGDVLDLHCLKKVWVTEEGEFYST